MDSFITGLLKFRHPLGSLVGFGVTALLTVFVLWQADQQNVGVLALCALPAGAVGAGLGGAAVLGFESGWRAVRPTRSRLLARIAKQNASSRLTGISHDAKAFITERLDAQSHAHPSLEFDWDQMHLAEELVDYDLARKHPNPLVVTFTDDAWACICSDPKRFGLVRKRFRVQRHREPVSVFKKL